MNQALTTADAVVIAAGCIRDADLAARTSTGCKSLITLNGRPAVSYLLDGLRASGAVSRVILVGDGATLDAVAGVDVRVEVPDDSASSVIRGIRAAEGSQRCLIMTGDMALASPDAIADLLENAPDSDVVYPIVSKDDFKGAFPDRTAYFVETREGKFTGSTCLLFRPDAALARADLLARLLNARNDPKSLMGLVGFGTALKLMFSTLALGEFQQLLSKALGLDCRVFISHFPELVVSIDSPSDIALMEAGLA